MTSFIVVTVPSPNPASMALQCLMSFNQGLVSGIASA